MTLIVVDATSGQKLNFLEIMLFEELDILAGYPSHVTLTTQYPVMNLSHLVGLTGATDTTPTTIEEDTGLTPAHPSLTVTFTPAASVFYIIVVNINGLQSRLQIADGSWCGPNLQVMNTDL